MDSDHSVISRCRPASSEHHAPRPRLEGHAAAAHARGTAPATSSPAIASSSSPNRISPRNARRRLTRVLRTTPSSVSIRVHSWKQTTAYGAHSASSTRACSSVKSTSSGSPSSISPASLPTGDSSAPAPMSSGAAGCSPRSADRRAPLCAAMRASSAARGSPNSSGESDGREPSMSLVKWACSMEGAGHGRPGTIGASRSKESPRRA
mmetsp:Transcript_65501/g.207046  ORF Transcript_65501/g.207046 Transcript_65501/m.207046 type:complete len:207 (+) Transcript_65501:294-914(+)